jgi:phage baseplate assembly protein W|tara:strand:- start:1308 stop:1712 length:405 start_codon:yes stop_codon:yes gene_type:complete
MAVQRQKITRLYKDFDLAFGKNAITGDINKKLDVNAVKQSMKNLILTELMERPFQPDLGSALAGLLFENATMFTTERIKVTIETLLENFERRAKINSIDVEPNIDNNRYDVSINFYVIGINEPQELEVKLERIR